RVAATVDLEVVERHPVAPGVGRVRVEQERGIHDLGDVYDRTGLQHPADFAERTRRRRHVLEYPAQEGGIEAAWLERQVGRIGLVQGVAAVQPRPAAEVLAGGG